MEEQNTPVWLEGGKINEVKFAEAFLRSHEMICCDGVFFSREGRVDDERLLKRHIYKMIKDHVCSGVSRKVDGLLSAMRLSCRYVKLELDPMCIHVANGTYHLQQGFSQQKHFCRHRLQASYDPLCPEPETWLGFLDELLRPVDILTLQEYMGYCLIPTTKAQKMLLITGNGGEGKSRVGVVMKSIFGSNLSLGSIAKIEQSPFARADLEHLLVMVDDDMQMQALASTNYLKSIITAELPMDLERKGEQSYQGMLTARFLAFGNDILRSLHDRSDGFFRRQIILSALPRDANRVDDPDLGSKLVAERDGIFLWCLQGLHRLMENGFRFTLSMEAEANLTKARYEGDNVLEFMCSQGYISYEFGASATSRQLYGAYCQWCADNALHPRNANSFWNQLRSRSLEYGLEYTHNVSIGGGRCARGFRGVRVCE